MLNKPINIGWWRILKLTFCCFLLCPNIQGQGIWELGGGLGLSNYQGELTSYNFDNGFVINFDVALGLHAKYYFNNQLDISTNFLFTGAKGSDALATAVGTQNRNLSFKSSIFQLTTRLEWNILGFEPGDLSQKFTPFITAGAGVFRFNPLALYEGAWIPLQPLGTEGQGSSVFPSKEKYKRVAFDIPLGGGIKLNLSDRITLTLDLIYHYTFTDYIDDVSTVYVTYPVLLEERGELAALLANRTGELTGGPPVVVPTGRLRGNSEVDDHFLTGLASIGYRFDSLNRKRISQKKVKCPKF